MTKNRFAAGDWFSLFGRQFEPLFAAGAVSCRFTPYRVDIKTVFYGILSVNAERVSGE